MGDASLILQQFPKTNRENKGAIMKTLILTIALMFGLLNAAIACPDGYYPCGEASKLCCPR